MTIKEAQEAVDRWIKEYGVRYFSELTNMTVLTEEVGELARAMARKYGDKSFKKVEKCNIGEKMADKEKIAESFARNFINEGVVVKGDLPKSPEFWNKLKADYLAQKGHNLKMWNRLTRFVPAEYLRPVANAKITQENIQKINTPNKKRLHQPHLDPRKPDQEGKKKITKNPRTLPRVFLYPQKELHTTSSVFFTHVVIKHENQFFFVFLTNTITCRCIIAITLPHSPNQRIAPQ